MTRAFNYLLTLKDPPSLYTASEVILVAEHETASAAWKSFKDAVTQWVQSTAEGAEAWESSVEDFNIGDFQLSEIETDDDLRSFARAHGIHEVRVSTKSYDDFRDFDEVLVNRRELKLGTTADRR